MSVRELTPQLAGLGALLLLTAAVYQGDGAAVGVVWLFVSVCSLGVANRTGSHRGKAAPHRKVHVISTALVVGFAAYAVATGVSAGTGAGVRVLVGLAAGGLVLLGFAVIGGAARSRSGI